MIQKNKEHCWLLVYVIISIAFTILHLGKRDSSSICIMCCCSHFQCDSVGLSIKKMTYAMIITFSTLVVEWTSEKSRWKNWKVHHSWFSQQIVKTCYVFKYSQNSFDLITILNQRHEVRTLIWDHLWYEVLDLSKWDFLFTISQTPKWISNIESKQIAPKKMYSFRQTECFLILCSPGALQDHLKYRQKYKVNKTLEKSNQKWKKKF